MSKTDIDTSFSSKEYKKLRRYVTRDLCVPVKEIATFHYKGSFNPNYQRIKISSITGEPLYVLAHEAGHYLDWWETPLLERKDFDKAYQEETWNIKEILIREARAWENGKKLLKRLGIKFDNKILEAEEVKAAEIYKHWSIRYAL